MQDSADQKTPQPSSPADAATPLEPPSLLHNPAVTIPNPAAPSSSTSCFPGERAGTATEFSDRLADFGPELTESTWTRVFQQTSGHCLAGQAVLQGAQALGHDLAAVDADRFRELLSTDVLIQIRSLARDTPELRLAHLLSFVHTITDDTIAMAAAAMPYLGPFSVPLDSAGHRGPRPHRADRTIGRGGARAPRSDASGTLHDVTCPADDSQADLRRKESSQRSPLTTCCRLSGG